MQLLSEVDRIDVELLILMLISLSLRLGILAYTS
jgi:hypothetical protein